MSFGARRWKAGTRIGPLLLGMGMVLVLTAGLAASPVAESVPEVRIADARGDWGHPNPYLHYPRGPDYIRMSWVFDTLIWKDEHGFRPALARSWTYDPGTLAFVDRGTDAAGHDVPADPGRNPVGEGDAAEGARAPGQNAGRPVSAADDRSSAGGRSRPMARGNGHDVGVLPAGPAQAVNLPDAAARPLT